MASAVTPVPMLTVSEAIDQIGLGKFQYRILGLVGLFWAADAMEVMLLSVLEPVLVCTWRISPVQVALLTTAVFLGMTLGSALFGMLGARFGRKTTVIQGSSFLALYGLFSAAAPNFKWLLILRFLVGFYMGTLPQAVIINTEMMPGTYRMKSYIVMCCSWAAGSVLVVILAIATLSYDSWRIFVSLCAVPPIVFLVLQYFWLPESPHYLQSKGRTDEAKATIEEVSRINKVELGTWILQKDEEIEDDIGQNSEKDITEVVRNDDDAGNDVAPKSENDCNSKHEKIDDKTPLIGQKGNLAELLSADWIRTTLIVWFLLYYCAFGYYGVILISPGIISGELCSSNLLPKGITSSTCSATSCHQLSISQYVELLWTTLAEAPGILLLLFLSDRFGRRRMMVIGFLVIAATSLGAGVCAVGHVVQVIFLFLGRGAAVGIFDLVVLYISEVYPTHLRSSGMGFSFFWARVGGMTTPYVSQVLSKSSTMTSQSVYCAVGVVAAAAAALLQVETAGRRIQ